VTAAAPTVIVGLTGGVGAGKSCAEALCREWHIPTADADRWAHESLATDPEVIRAVADEFERRYGSSALQADGTPDRVLLAEKAFADSSFLRLLETLIHPRVRTRAATWVAAQRAARVPLAVLVVPLLLESGMQAQVDCVLVIAASRATRIARLARTRGWDARACERRMAAQLDERERRRQADYVVENEGSPEDFAVALRATLDQITGVHGQPSH
jgi:dephospho-CoA kinase